MTLTNKERGQLQAVGRAIKEALEPLIARIEALEAGGVKYAGTFQRAVGYRRGDVVTKGGNMWTCLADAPAGTEPGAPGSARHWQLAARGARPETLRRAAT